MLIKKVKKRLIIILISTALLLLSITYLLKNLEKNILYFFSPTQISNDPNVIIDKEEIRVGGMVKEGSLLVQRNEIKFVITDFEYEIHNFCYISLFLDNRCKCSFYLNFIL